MAKKYIGIWQALNIIERIQKKEEKHYGITPVFFALNAARDYIKKLPAADVQEIKRGEWKINSDGYYPYCSECGKEPNNGIMSKFCPECGAKMDGKDGEK